MRILITGVSGQDGSYLAEQLIAEDHDVYGLRRLNRLGWAHGIVGLKHIIGDITDLHAIEHAVRVSRPDEIYNLAAITSPGSSWNVDFSPTLAEVTALSVVNLMNVVIKYAPNAHVVHASSSAIYDPQRYGLYGASKMFAHNVIQGCRNGQSIHASNAVMFSHTSVRQSPIYLARYVTRMVSRIIRDENTRLTLNSLSSKRSWGFAPDIVRALPMIARTNTPGDYDVASEDHSVYELVDAAFQAIGVSDWSSYVDIEPGVDWCEPAPFGRSIHDLGWYPKIKFEEAIARIIEEDVTMICKSP